MSNMNNLEVDPNIEGVETTNEETQASSEETTALTTSEQNDDGVAKQASREERPALTPSDSTKAAPILDITENGIFSDPELMEAYFPLVSNILRNSTETTNLTIEEVNQLSKYALAKAIFTNDSLNPIKGMMDNQLHHPNGTTFGPKPNKPKLSDGDTLDLTDITALEPTMHGGGVVTYPLVNSGFRIKLEPIGVDKQILLEEAITHRIGEIGRSTVGGGILAMDAIIIDTVIDRILDRIIDHNIKDVEVGDKATIRGLINHKDIRPLVAIMNGIMHLDGYDYDVPCEKCKTLNRMNLNVIRSIQYDHGKLTEAQLDQLLIPIKGEISIKNIRKYQEAFVAHEESKLFTIGKLKYRVHTRTGSIDTKMESYGLVFNLLEKLAREAVGINGIKSKETVYAKCDELLRRMWHLHYLPVVRSIDVILPDGSTKTAKEPVVILELLKNLSVSDETGEVASYLTMFAHDNVVTFATHVPKCSSCGAEVDELRHYDPVIDFFIRRMSHKLSTSIVQEVMIRS